MDSQAMNQVSPAYVPDPQNGLASSNALHFPIGVAIQPEHLSLKPDLLKAEFNRLTPENAMKWNFIQREEGTFTWAEADALANFARQNNCKLTGHTVVWYRETPAWVYNGDLEAIKGRLRTHIFALASRYSDVVDSWDVVNEAINDGDYSLRDFPQYSEDVMYWAYKYAEEALEAQEKGSSEGKLYYNDYNLTLKVDAIIALLQNLRDRGAAVHGVGFQTHVRLFWPSVKKIRAAFDKVVAAGFKIKISELDVSVYNDYPPPDHSFVAAPEVPFTPELDAKISARYSEIFELLRGYKQHITSVTLWGISDAHTWLQHEPVAGRANYPLLFDGEHNPKAAYHKIKKF